MNVAEPPYRASVHAKKQPPVPSAASSGAFCWAVAPPVTARNPENHPPPGVPPVNVRCAIVTKIGEEATSFQAKYAPPAPSPVTRMPV